MDVFAKLENGSDKRFCVRASPNYELAALNSKQRSTNCKHHWKSFKYIYKLVTRV